MNEDHPELVFDRFRSGDEFYRAAEDITRRAHSWKDGEPRLAEAAYAKHQAEFRKVYEDAGAGLVSRRHQRDREIIRGLFLKSVQEVGFASLENMQDLLAHWNRRYLTGDAELTDLARDLALWLPFTTMLSVPYHPLLEDVPNWWDDQPPHPPVPPGTTLEDLGISLEDIQAGLGEEDFSYILEEGGGEKLPLVV